MLYVKPFVPVTDSSLLSFTIWEAEGAVRLNEDFSTQHRLPNGLFLLDVPLPVYRLHA